MVGYVLRSMMRRSALQRALGGHFNGLELTEIVTAARDFPITSRVDVHTLEDVPGPERLELNDIGVVRLRLSEPLFVDPYEENRSTGAFVIVDEATNETVGAGMVLSAS